MNRQKPKAYILTKNDSTAIQKSSVYAAKMLSGMIKTCLGPRAMQKIVLTKINTVEHTNDGISILRELDVSFPTARCLIELSQTQDDECGDGTTSVLILTAELLEKVVKLLEEFHPIKVCKKLKIFKEKILNFVETLATKGGFGDVDLLKVIEAAVSTKLCSQINVPIGAMAFEAIKKLCVEEGNKIDIKNNLKVVKVLGDFKECKVVDGIVIDKDIVHTQMSKSVENPKILLLDCGLEYKKGESATNIELENADDFTKMLVEEEDQIKKLCNTIIGLEPNIVVCGKGVCDLASSILQEKNITCLRRTSKIHLKRIAKATGSFIVSCIDDAKSEHLGECGKFEYKKIGKEYFSVFSNCKDPKAISLILCGPTKDINNELERNFMDAIKVAKNIVEDKRTFPGGGATEMAVSVFANSLSESANSLLEKKIGDAITSAFQIIPNILLTNCGERNPLEKINSLFSQVKTTKNYFIGINGITGGIVDTREVVNEPFIVKIQCFKSVFDAVIQLIRIDGIVECVKIGNE
ncbi:CCT3 [Ecytonucleospora hepatopenaei]|uniref:CCT3 n=1 Tax=Ecytonucleospora hepatopenaei TaxID=646526 RepID=A0A1W0E5H8_9MICR|nr:CCT3 [Ecytonucleospora hepatopenaei]